MRFATINKCDTINAENGVAVSLWVQGCPHACDGCFNKKTWKFEGGEIFSLKTELELMSALDSKYITTFSVLGGEPMAPQHREEILLLVERVKLIYPEKKIMMWTGYRIEELEDDGVNIDLFDTIVDGKYDKNIPKNHRLAGSGNQRIFKQISGRWGVSV